ncbi:MAG: helix-turn-helix domain-containing protein [Ruminococcus sp.]|nr:helix-turn-helix domain-containing protein [Ruminococcus sp.]
MNRITYWDGCKQTYNPFDEPLYGDNTAHIKALMRVQADVIKYALTKHQAIIVDYCICKGYRQKDVAALLGISQSSVSRALKAALNVIRKYIVICDKALKYYHKETEE